MTSIDCIKQQKLYINSFGRGVSFVSAHDVYLVDQAGTDYLDFTSNYGVNILGYSNTALKEGLKEQIDTLVNAHTSFSNPIRTKALETLIKRANISGLRKCYFCNSGSEAIDTALKFSHLHTNRTKFIAIKNSYHGKTIGSVSVTSANNHKYQKSLATMLLDVGYLPANDVTALAGLDTSVAAVLVELVQGEGGIYPLDQTYVTALSKKCEELGILFIVDEIQTGCGRIGSFLAAHQYDIPYLSMMTLGKGLGGGIPIGALLLTSEINESIQKGIQSSTFGANPLAMRGVVETLAQLDDAFFEQVQKTATYLQQQLEPLATRYDHIKEIRCHGLMCGITFTNELAGAMIKGLQQQQVLVVPSGPDTIRLLPPLICTKDHIDKFLVAFENVLTQTA